MNEHEKALPAGGPAKPTQNAVKIYVISSRERLLLPLAFCFCLLLVNTLLWSGPTAGLTASVCVWYGLLGLYLGRTLLNTWESRVLLAVNLALAATLALGSNWYFRAWNLLALLALLLRLGCLDADGHFRTPASPLARRVAPPPQQARTGLRLPLPYGQWLAAADVEELLKVKAAFSQALEALLRAAGLAAADVACLALAGALGEHCPPACLEELGFLPSGMGRRVRAVGNSSLDGAALLAAEPWRLPALARWCAAATLVPVAEDPGFHADYLRHMRFGV